MERYIFGILVLICLIFINSRVLCADCNSNQDCTATSFTLATCSSGNCDCVNTQYASVRTGCALKLQKPKISTTEGRSTFLITGTSDLLVCSTVAGAKRYDWYYNDNLLYSGENIISINRTGKYKCKAIAWTLSLNSDTSDEIVITKIGVGKYPWNLTVGISAESKIYNGRSVSLTCIGAPMGYMDKVIFERTYENLVTEEAYSITSMSEVLNMSYALDGVSIRCTLDSFKAIYFSPSVNSVTLPTVCDIMNPANNGCAALPITAAVLTVHDPVIGLITTDTTYNVGADGPILNCTTTPAPQYLDSSKPLEYTFLAGTKSLWTGTSSTYTVDTRTSSSTAYTCQVNFDGVNTTSTPSVIITVSNDYLAVPTIIKKSAGEIEIESTLVLSCGDSSYVADSYQWSISGKTIERQYDKTIQIYKFAIADIGLYQCRAVKSRYTTADATFDAIMKPTATRLTAGNFYAAAGSYDFKCDSGTGGNTAWSYLWLKNGQSTRISSGTYNIYGANAASHDGSYTCNLMYNGATRTSDPLTVQIITLKPTITIQPSVMRNFYGAGVRYVLWCNTDSGVTAGWTYTWTKDTIDMQINSDTYEITQASAAIHDGVYTCISTYSGVSTSSDALTVIIVAATLAMNDTNGQISADKAFNVGEDGPKLTCAVTRQLPNANTLVYTFWDDVSVLQQGSSVNYIIDTSVPSNTTYRCSVTYDWFTTFSQTSARIAVTMKPYISIRPISSFYGAGNNYVLKCNTDSRVINGWTFSWIKNNTDLHNNADVYSITNATATLHDGVYTCTSTYNRVASTSDAVTVTIIAAVMTISDVGGPILTDTTYNVGSAGPTLTCTTTPPLANASTVTYTFWDSVSSIQSSSSETYMVNGYIPSNTTFRCGVNYDGSTTYSSISARIAFSNDYIAVPTLSKTSLEDLAVGSNFVLTCGDHTIVVDYYQWFFDDVLIENHIANVLQRISFTESDIGVYKCRAVKSRYTTANASFSAIMKPRISRNPSGTFYGAGVNYSLTCISGSNLKIGWAFSWTKELTDMQINSGVYSITNATASLHDGVYTCTSTYNRIASTSDALTVTVVAATLIVEDSYGPISIDTTYNVGAEGPTLTCRTTSQLPSENTATYTFMSDTTSVQEGSLNTYTLDNSIRSNTSYKCSVTYDGSITYSPTSPRIEFSEDFIAVSSIIKTSLGDITIGSTLTLLYGETIDADFYQWFFDNTMIENQSNKRLERPRFTERDIGVYKCRAVKSRYTTANATFTAGIKPEIIRQTSGTFYGAGVNYDLMCNIGLTITTGWTFSWTKNNNDLFNDAEVYSIANATATLHDGVYTCTSTYNMIASTSNALTVTVAAAVMTTSDFGGPILTDTTYNVGSAGPTLTCTTTPPLANASTVIFTFLNDTSSVHSSYSETYALNINIPSNTTYKCSVTYEGSTTYSPTSVRIAFSNDYIAVPTLSKTSLEDLAVGSNFVLTCGVPTIVVDYYQWFFDDVLIENHIANVLQRTRFTESDIGKYKCRAVKSRYTTANATFPAIMKPAITRQTSGTFYGAGVNYVLMCNSGSMETNGWTYTWAKDNRDLNIHADNYVITNATSAIHDGTYTCNSTYNFVSSTSNAITVSVVAAILIVEDSHGPISNDTTYNVGADGPTLTCSTTRPLPSDNTVTYIFMNDTSSIEASSSNVYTLISNIPSSSTYKCSVTYDESTTLSPSSARIAFSNNFISDPSIVKVSLGDITFGSTLALSCGDTTINADFYQWFFDETMIENQSNKRLERSRFTERDIGVYKCRAVKSRYTTANATFTAGMKPEITRQPAGSFYVAGVNYDLKCNTGLTVTTVWTFSWTMDNNDLHNDAEVYSITNATATLHDGVYTCTSTYNRIASTSDALTVTVVAATLIVADYHSSISIDTTY
ncbi:uncharacterized protein LOC131932407, partial [Physella acuta]|uniref:uncharacterized protein LOC131932407 n=1 Tax=Physella acuta TaxID=109671 RepID=UPI0027DE9F26